MSSESSTCCFRCSWGCCFCKLKPYKLPANFTLPRNIVQLHPNDTALVKKAAACLGSAFLGNTQVPGAPVMKESYYGKESRDDKPLDEFSSNDVGLRNYCFWLMNFTFYRCLPFGGVFVYVEDTNDDDEEDTSKRTGFQNVFVSSVAVCIPPNNCKWDVYEDYHPSVWGLSLCPWNCSAVGLPPPSVLLSCCYDSAKRLRTIDQADIEMRHRLMLNKQYWYMHALGTTPKMQKKGRASALVEVLSQLSDTDDAEMYIESGSEKNIQFYINRNFIKMRTITPLPYSTSTALIRLRKNHRTNSMTNNDEYRIADSSTGNAKDQEAWTMENM
jgi:hypothetical protein